MVTVPILECLIVRNGHSAPQSAIPLLTMDVFTHWLSSEVRSGGRVIAFFALPEILQCEAKTKTLIAIVTHDASSELHIVKVMVDGSYPSLTGRFPEMHLFERDVYERYGIEPQGHPWLKPVRFPHADGPQIGDADFYRVTGHEVHEVAVGPIHAGVIECGHFRFQCLGEVVMHLEISLGYHHRGVAHILQGGPDVRTLGLMEAVSGDATIAHAWAYCTTLESLSDTPVAPRGQIIRALALEFERLANHTGDMGALAGDTGFLPTLSFCGRLRGDWLNMSALVCGSRFGRGLLTLGGTFFDIDADMARTLRQRITEAARDVHGAIQLMWDSSSVMARMTGIGTVPQEQAKNLGMVGVAARACGLARDVRHTHPLPNLPAPPLMQVAAMDHGHTGCDVLARARVRHDEITASVAYCLYLLDMLEGSDTGVTRLEQQTEGHSLAPAHIAVALVEGWRGEVCHVALTDAQGAFADYEIFDPSFHNWMGLALALREQQISDFPLCNKSFNLSYCGHDL